MKTCSRKFIPYGRQWIDEDDIRAVVDVLKSDYLTTGSSVGVFEEKIAKTAGTKYAVAVSSGTAALHAACFAAGLTRGDEAVTTPMTFAATANSILYAGAKPVFADIDSKTYNIEPDEVRKRITRKTKVIIPVHFAGLPCDMDKVLKIADDHGLVVIEDAAHALGAEYKGRKIGSIGDMAIFSFHPVKHITTGEGGAVVTNRAELYEKLIMFRNHGITREPAKFEINGGPWHYEEHFLGYNFRLTDFQAALGISQLGKLGRFLSERNKLAMRYNEAFKNVDEIVSAPFQKNIRHAWHLYVIRIKLEKLKIGRKEIFEELVRRNIGANVHYIPVYYHPYYQRIGYKKGLCPNAEKLYEEIITLPLFPMMSEEDIDYVADNVKDILLKNRKQLLNP